MARNYTTIDLFRSVNESLITNEAIEDVPPKVATGEEPNITATSAAKTTESDKTRPSKVHARRRNRRATESRKPRHKRVESARKTARTESVIKKRIRKRATESVEDVRDLTVDICPVCGSKEFDAENQVCPICGEPTNKYIVADQDSIDTNEDDFTSIEIDGEDKILIDEEGNTAIEEPDIVNDVLDEGTHIIVTDPTDPDNNTITIDSGVATLTDEGTPIMESEDPTATDSAVQIAYLRFDEPIKEVTDLLVEDNENKVDVKQEDEGTVITATLPNLEEVVTESDDEGVVNVNDVADIDIELEELPNGTLVHAENVDNVDDLIDIVNELLPEDAQIEENPDAYEDEEEEVEEDEEVTDPIEEDVDVEDDVIEDEEVEEEDIDDEVIEDEEEEE